MVKKIDLTKPMITLKCRMCPTKKKIDTIRYAVIHNKIVDEGDKDTVLTVKNDEYCLHRVGSDRTFWCESCHTKSI